MERKWKWERKEGQTKTRYKERDWELDIKSETKQEPRGINSVDAYESREGHIDKNREIYKNLQKTQEKI